MSILSSMSISPSMSWQLLLTSQFARMNKDVDKDVIKAFRSIDRSWFVSSQVSGAFNAQSKEEALEIFKKVCSKSNLSGDWNGVYLQNGEHYYFSLHLNFIDGTIMGKGSNTNSQQSFDVSGSYNIEEGTFLWTHKYSENEQTVLYEGVWNDGDIVGTRQIGETSDGFRISPQKNGPYCYSSRPVFLGYGVNNSATYMHIIGVMYIQELLKKPKVRILDVGCGSGFVTAVLALAAQDPEIVLGVDHIEEFVQKGYQLIEWFVPQLSNRISFRQLDARFGCGEDKFDIIHLGASPNSIAELEPIIDNLKVGGKLIGPVTLHGYQRFVLITKNRSGYSVNELFDVRYTTLQDIQSQISQ